MSRRPPDPRTLRVARSGQRMAPGGRRWSESPVPRPGKRRIRAVGAPASAEWDIALYPVEFLTPPEGQPAAAIVGGGGDSTWSDESDATYVDFDVAPIEMGLAMIEAYDLPPGATVDGASIWVRARATADPLGTYVTASASNAVDETYYASGAEDVTTSWTEYQFAPFDYVPTVAAIEAGEIMVSLLAIHGSLDPCDVHVSRVWVEIWGHA